MHVSVQEFGVLFCFVLIFFCFFFPSIISLSSLYILASQRPAAYKELKVYFWHHFFFNKVSLCTSGMQPIAVAIACTVGGASEICLTNTWTGNRSLARRSYPKPRSTFYYVCKVPLCKLCNCYFFVLVLLFSYFAMLWLALLLTNLLALLFSPFGWRYKHFISLIGMSKLFRPAFSASYTTHFPVRLKATEVPVVLGASLC